MNEYRDQILQEMHAAIDTSMVEMGLDPLSKDDDGNHVFRIRSVSGTIRVLYEPEHLMLAGYDVTAVAVTDIEASASLLEELNRLNGLSTGTCVFHRDRTVYVQRVVATSNGTDLTIASGMATVCWVAAGIGAKTATDYGGATPHPVPLG